MGLSRKQGSKLTSGYFKQLTIITQTIFSPTRLCLSLFKIFFYRESSPKCSLVASYPFLKYQFKCSFAYVSICTNSNQTHFPLVLGMQCSWHSSLINLSALRHNFAFIHMCVCARARMHACVRMCIRLHQMHLLHIMACNSSNS